MRKSKQLPALLLPSPRPSVGWAAVVRLALVAASALSLAAGAAHAQTILYEQDFERPNPPNGFVDTTGRDVSQQTVNELYSGQPAGFTFSQQFTVETLEINGDVAFGGGYQDPSGRGGDHALGMLSTTQPDLLGLTFDVGEFDFLNAAIDISSIDLDGVGGPFGAEGTEPVFEFRLVDGTGLSGIVLDSEQATGSMSPRNVFDWVQVIVGLDATGSTNGTVTLVIDLFSGGYAALDNFVIAASDTPGEVPEPTTALLLGLGLVGLARSARG